MNEFRGQRPSSGLIAFQCVAARSGPLSIDIVTTCSNDVVMVYAVMVYAVTVYAVTVS